MGCRHDLLLCCSVRFVVVLRVCLTLFAARCSYNPSPLPSTTLPPFHRILLWAVAFKFEAMTPGMLNVVGIICLGLFLASWDENDKQFSLPGFLMILGASCFSGLRLVGCRASLRPRTPLEQRCFVPKHVATSAKYS